MLDLGLESADQLAVLGEHGQVEVVVVVGDEDLVVGVDADADRVVGETLAADLANEVARVVEDLDAVSAIVADVDLLADGRSARRGISGIGAAHAVGKLEILGAVELLQDVAVDVEDEHTHDLALDDHDASLVVDADAARMLQDVGAELADELAVLVVDLNLMRGRSLGDDNVARLLDNRHSIGVQELTVAFAALAELELEAAVLVEYLNAMRVGVGHNDVVVGVDGHAARLGELAVVDAELAELAVVDHLGARIRRV